MKNATRPAIFKWRQTAPELILCAVRWYLQYSLSLRDVEELFAERGRRRIIRRSGVGFNVTVPNWKSGCVVSSSRRTNPGVSMRHIFESRAVGVTCIGPSIPRVPPSTSCCRRYAKPRRPSAWLEEFPHLKNWYDRIEARPAVQRGIAVPWEAAVRTPPLPA